MNSSMFKGSMVAPVMCLLLLCHACHNDLAFFLLKWNIDHQKSNAVDLVIFWTFMMTGGWREVNLNSLQWDCPKNTKLIISSLIILCGLDLVTISLIDLGICHCKTVVMVSVQLVQNEICQSISSLFFVSRLFYFTLFHLHLKFCTELYYHPLSSRVRLPTQWYPRSGGNVSSSQHRSYLELNICWLWSQCKDFPLFLNLYIFESDFYSPLLY